MTIKTLYAAVFLKHQDQQLPIGLEKNRDCYKVNGYERQDMSMD